MAFPFRSETQALRQRLLIAIGSGGVLGLSAIGCGSTHEPLAKSPAPQMASGSGGGGSGGKGTRRKRGHGQGPGGGRRRGRGHGHGHGWYARNIDDDRDVPDGQSGRAHLLPARTDGGQGALRLRPGAQVSDAHRCRSDGRVPAERLLAETNGLRRLLQSGGHRRRAAG